LTVPLHLRDDGAWLLFPTVESHDCGNDIDQYEVWVGDDGPVQVATRAALGDPLCIRRGASRVAARDANGWVLQTISRRAVIAPPKRAVIVIEASASAAMALEDPAAVLEAWPGQVECSVYLARGCDFEHRVGRADASSLQLWLDRATFQGGVDATLALNAALLEAKRRGLRSIYWVHGTASRALHRGGGECPEGVRIVALPVRRGLHVLRSEGPFAKAVVELDWVHDTQQDRMHALARFIEHGDNGAFSRTLERAEANPGDCIVVGDHLARLWAAREARKRAVDSPVAGSELAAQYRLVTAGAAAVVLERAEQYREHGLDPGAELGREPAGDAGGGPVPEPSSWLLLATGLLLTLCIRRRRVG
jgi:hypothetical protein